MRKCLTHSPKLKVSVAVEMMMIPKTIQELTANHAILTIQVSQWMRGQHDGEKSR